VLEAQRKCVESRMTEESAACCGVNLAGVLVFFGGVLFSASLMIFADSTPVCRYYDYGPLVAGGFAVVVAVVLAAG
jgi:hypothetical protein